MRAAAIAAGARRQRAQQRLRQAKWTDEVRRERPLELLAVCVGEQLQRRSAEIRGVVHQDVEAAQMLQRAGHAGGHILGPSGVGSDERDADVLGDPAAPLLISALERGELLALWEPYAGLRRLGRPVDLLWLQKEDATHVLVKPRHRELSTQSAVDWFELWLNGREDPYPGKAEQYVSRKHAND